MGQEGMLGWGAVIARLVGGVEATLEGDPERPRWLGNLGSGFRVHYEGSRNLGDLEAAIAMSEAAVDATPRDNPDRLTWLRYLEMDLHELESAVRATPEGDTDRASGMSMLGVHLGKRYEQTGNLADLDAAIEKFEEAVEATPEGHPDRAG